MNESIDKPTALLLIQALDDGRLDYLFQAAHVDYTERDGFANQNATLGLPRDAVAHLLGAVRRAQGLTILAGAWGDYAGWITLSAEMVELLHWIDIRAGFDFSSATELPDDEIRHVQNRILIEEVLPLGLTMGELSPTNEIELSQAMNGARRMLQEGRKPSTDYERWVLRFFEMMKRLPELAAAPLTVDRLCELHAQLALDKTTGGVYRTSEHTENPGVGFAADGRGALPQRIPSEMSAIASYATDSQKPFVHPLVKTIVYFYWIRRVQPFAVANGLFARLIAHIYEYQQGYRALPWTPLTRTQSSEWAVPPPNVGEPRFDATTFVITRLHLFLNAYIEAERELDGASRRYRALCARFHGLGINHRHARILDKAFETPTTVFTIRHHARARGLAYETARQDFLQLVKLGYLEQTKRGRVFEFRLAMGAEKKPSGPLES
ncbi:MAG: Fic family protein [Coriobacteriia bacterium]|nr:Fic family protein [Coriobacteriia bacterium]